MNRMLKPRLLTSNNLKLWQTLAPRFSTDTGSKEHIDSLVKGKKLVVFMDGTAEVPRGAFSRVVVEILNFHGIKHFDHYNLLEDEDLRKGVKEFSPVLAVPIVFIGGECVGTYIDVFVMHKNGELIEELKKGGIRSALLDRAKEND